jgi:predicted outer membrane repeat protein
MRGGLWWLVILLTGTIPALADTTWVAAGNVAGNWTAANSPYMIQGTINVPTGNSLEIGPGVRVYFTGPFSLRVDSAAQFNALGVEGDSVVFTTDTLANPQRWRGIKARKSAPDTLRMDYCVVEYSHEESFGDDADMFSYCRVHLAHSSFRYSYGEVAAFLIGGCDVRIDSCMFTSNRGADYGAVWIVGGANPVVNGCLFSENEGTYSGALALAGHYSYDITGCNFLSNRGVAGGACELECEGNFQGCIFADNIATGGGAVYMEHVGGFNFADCVFINNRATGYDGGGAIQAGQTNGTFHHCEFTGNAAPHGGAMLCEIWEWAEDFEFTDCRFSGNTATESGGVLYGDARTIWTRCVFDSNDAPDGGVMTLRTWDFKMDHCTVVANAAADTGSIIRVTSGGPAAIVRNSVMAFNRDAPTWAWYQYDETGEIHVTRVDSCHHNLFFGNSGGDFAYDTLGLGEVNTRNANGDSCDAFYNLYLDPRLVDVAGGDYRLLDSSPCIDAGDPASPADSDGTVADIGAFSSPYLPDAVEPSILPPSSFILSAYPNPFNSTTTLRFSVPTAGRVTVAVYNVLGERVAELVNGTLTAGEQRVQWNAESQSSGVYFIALMSGTQRLCRKVVLLK